MYKTNPSDIEWLSMLAKEGEGDLDEYYPKTATGTLKPSDPYYGRNIIWDGISGRMLRVYPSNVQAIEGNIFDKDKLAAIVSGIDQAYDRLVFTAPYGDVGAIDLINIKESIKYEEEDPYTTGDEELDRYLAEGNDYIEEEHGVDPDDPDEAEEFAEIKAELDDSLQEAVDNNEGDLGDFWVQIRDGNHRAFGAFAAGEPYIYMIVMDNTIQDLDKNYPEDRMIIDALE